METIKKAKNVLRDTKEYEKIKTKQCISLSEKLRLQAKEVTH